MTAITDMVDLEKRGAIDIVGAHQIHEAPGPDRPASLRRQYPQDPHLSEAGATPFLHFDRAHPEVSRLAILILDWSTHDGAEDTSADRLA